MTSLAEAVTAKMARNAPSVKNFIVKQAEDEKKNEEIVRQGKREAKAVNHNEARHWA